MIGHKNTACSLLFTSLPIAFQPVLDQATGLVFHTRKSITNPSFGYLFLENDLGMYFLGSLRLDAIEVCNVVADFLDELERRT